MVYVSSVSVTHVSEVLFPQSVVRLFSKILTPFFSGSVLSILKENIENWEKKRRKINRILRSRRRNLRFTQNWGRNDTEKHGAGEPAAPQIGFEICGRRLPALWNWACCRVWIWLSECLCWCFLESKQIHSGINRSTDCAVRFDETNHLIVCFSRFRSLLKYLEGTSRTGNNFVKFDRGAAVRQSKVPLGTERNLLESWEEDGWDDRKMDMTTSWETWKRRRTVWSEGWSVWFRRRKYLREGQLSAWEKNDPEHWILQFLTNTRKGETFMKYPRERVEEYRWRS